MIQSVRNFFFKKKELARERVQEDYTRFLPNEIILEIFSHLNVLDRKNCRLVCRRWKKCESDDTLWKNPSVFKTAFGKAKWAKYFGDVGEEPLISGNIRSVLIRPCPFWPQMRVIDTHMLVLIPKEINGEALSLKKLSLIIQNPKVGKPFHSAYIRDFWIEKGKGIEAAAKSHWVLMTRNVIPGSKNIHLEDQKILLSQISRKVGVAYEIPNALDACICILMNKISKQKEFPERTFSNCMEESGGKTNGYASQTVVGIWRSHLYCSWFYTSPHKQLGLAVMRKL